jgi:hypothetical protein
MTYKEYLELMISLETDPVKLFKLRQEWHKEWKKLVKFYSPNGAHFAYFTD